VAEGSGVREYRRQAAVKSADARVHEMCASALICYHQNGTHEAKLWQNRRQPLTHTRRGRSSPIGDVPRRAVFVRLEVFLGCCRQDRIRT